PDYATYPLMFHSPHAVYAWQLDMAQRVSYRQLPEIHFRGLTPPDYIVAFGFNVSDARRTIASYQDRGVQYDEVARLPVHWPDQSRPELFWHSFVPVPLGSPESDGVFFFKREPT